MIVIQLTRIQYGHIKGMLERNGFAEFEKRGITAIQFDDTSFAAIAQVEVLFDAASIDKWIEILQFLKGI